MIKRLLIVASLSAAILLSGCVPLLVGAAGGVVATHIADKYDDRAAQKDEQNKSASD